MRICVRRPVWDSAECQSLIRRILVLVEDSWHVLDVEPADFEETVWSQNATSIDFELMRYASVAASYSVASKVHQSSLEVPNPQFSFAEVSTYISEPVRILVENRFTDGALLDASIKCFGEKALVSLYENSGLVLEHSGGTGEMVKFVRYFKKRAASMGIPSRVFVVIDGDCRFDGDESGQACNASAKVEADCAREGGTTHRWIKRAVENYVPDEALAAWANTTARMKKVNVVTSMDREQRDFSNLKTGIPKKPSPEEIVMYGRMSVSDLKEFDGGFGDDFVIATMLDNNGLLRKEITREALSSRDGKSELVRLVDSISSIC